MVCIWPFDVVKAPGFPLADYPIETISMISEYERKADSLLLGSSFVSFSSHFPPSHDARQAETATEQLWVDIVYYWWLV